MVMKGAGMIWAGALENSEQSDACVRINIVGVVASSPVVGSSILKVVEKDGNSCSRNREATKLEAAVETDSY